tara:strand:+ start:666 stop:1028 length:363 start_codon:yes stop_codon:yes gene_type:complete
MKKIYLSTLLAVFVNTAFASFPINENKLDKSKSIELLDSSESSLIGNLSLACAVLSMLTIMGLSLPPIFILLSLPAVVLGAMSLSTKGRIQGLIGMIIGLAEILLIILALVIFSSIAGWF